MSANQSRSLGAIVCLLAGALFCTAQYNPSVRTRGSVTNGQVVVFDDVSGRYIRGATGDEAAVSHSHSDLVTNTATLTSNYLVRGMGSARVAPSSVTEASLTNTAALAASALQSESDTNAVAQLAAHLADATAAHAAGAVSATGTWSDVQAAIEALEALGGTDSNAVVVAGSGGISVAVSTSGTVRTYTVSDDDAGAGGGSVTNLPDLADVQADASVLNPQVLMWHPGGWSNDLVTLDNLEDVDLQGSSPPAGNVLLVDGSGIWTNGTITGTSITDGTVSNADLAASSVTSNKIDWSTMPSGLQDGDDVGGGGGVTNLNDLADVDAGSPSVDHVLGWDGTNWTPRADATGVGGGTTNAAEIGVAFVPTNSTPATADVEAHLVAFDQAIGGLGGGGGIVNTVLTTSANSSWDAGTGTLILDTNDVEGVGGGGGGMTNRVIWYPATAMEYTETSIPALAPRTNTVAAMFAAQDDTTAEYVRGSFAADAARTQITWTAIGYGGATGQTAVIVGYMVGGVQTAWTSVTGYPGTVSASISAFSDHAVSAAVSLSAGDVVYWREHRNTAVAGDFVGDFFVSGVLVEVE